MKFTTQVSVNEKLNASARQMWSIVREFDGLPQYVDGIHTCTLSTNDAGETVRKSIIGDGIVAEEKLDLLDDSNYTLAYTLVYTDLPVAEYTSTLKLEPVDEKSCMIHWNAQMTPRGISDEEVRNIIIGFYTSAIEGLNNMVVQKN